MDPIIRYNFDSVNSFVDSERMRAESLLEEAKARRWKLWAGVTLRFAGAIAIVLIAIGLFAWLVDGKTSVASGYVESLFGRTTLQDPAFTEEQLNATPQSEVPATAGRDAESRGLNEVGSASRNPRTEEAADAAEPNSDDSRDASQTYKRRPRRAEPTSNTPSGPRSQSTTSPAETISTAAPHRALEGELRGQIHKLEMSLADANAQRERIAQQKSNLSLQKDNLVASRGQLAARLQERTDERDKMVSALRKSLQAEIGSREVEIPSGGDDILVSFSERILFPSGSTELNDPGREALLKLSRELEQTRHIIVIVGHTDDVPIKGELRGVYPTNWELAGARASRVVRLFEQAGIDGNRLSAVSHGETQPVAANDVENSRARNRRIEIRVISAANDESPGR